MAPVRSSRSFADELAGHARRAVDDVEEAVSMVDVGGDHLLTIFTSPGGQAAAPTGMVLCHSFLELSMLQKTELDLARAAARHGFAGVYMQAPGAGDSEGSPERCTVEARVKTALESARLLRENVPACERICYFGARLGGAIATLAAERDPLAGALAVWDPVFDAATYWKQVRRLARVIAVVGRQRSFEDPAKELARKGWASMFGNTVTNVLVADLDEVSSAGRSRIDVPVLVLSLNDQMVATTIERLAVVSDNIEGVSLGRPDMGHLGLREAPEAIAPTIDWMTRKLA